MGNASNSLFPFPTHRKLIEGLTYFPTVLEFAAMHKIKAVIEEFPMTEEGVQEAFEKLDAGKLHFKAVLVAQ